MKLITSTERMTNMEKDQMTKVINQITEDLHNKVVKVIVKDGYRYYTDTLTESKVCVITTKEETVELYHKVFYTDVQNKTDRPRLTMYVGQPDTGKTYQALQQAKEYPQVLFKMCHENLNMETLLEDFDLIDGKAQYKPSLALQMMTGTEPGVIIFDEFNTLRTGVIKTLQPIFDNTSEHFEYRGKVYKKNMDCHFIITLNDKDKGISIVPDAILSRSALQWFEPVSVKTIAQWTNTSEAYVTALSEIYKILNLSAIFGTRQVKTLHGKSVNVVRNHLTGLCKMKQIDTALLETLPMQHLLAKL